MLWEKKKCGSNQDAQWLTRAENQMSEDRHFRYRSNWKETLD